MIKLTYTQLTTILFVMLFFHIFDDYYLQGILASMKQRKWWENQEGYNEKYKNDYIPALLCHAFSWSFMINLPFIILTKGNCFFIFVSLAFNFVFHSLIDNAKANLKQINLCKDQIFHVLQVFITWACYAILFERLEQWVIILK